MANKKFSEFVLKTSSSNISHIVGYSGAENVQITPANFVTTGGTGIFLPLAGGTMTGALVVDSTATVNDILTASLGLSVTGGAVGSAKLVQLANNFVYLYGGSSGLVLGNGNGTTNLKVSGDFSWELAGVEKMKLSTAGNLGIGVTPSAKLDLVGTNRLQLRTNEGDFPELRALTADGSAFKELGLNGLQVVFKTSSTEKMRLTSDGKLGIGGAPTDATFSVKGTGVNTGVPNVLMTANLVRENNTTGLSIGYRTDETTAVLAPRTASGNLAVYNFNGSAWGETARFTSNNRLGVGTSTPTTTLDVRGVITSSDGAGQLATFANVGTDLVLTANAGQTNVTAKMLFKSSGSGGGTITTKMIIDESGNLIVGSEAPNPYLAFISTGGNGNNERARLYGYANGGTYGGGLKIETRNNSNVFEERFRIDNLGDVTFNGDVSMNRGNQSTGELKLGGTTDAGFVDFDGTSLQLNTQRNPNSGAFTNTAKSQASIQLNGASGGSSINFFTASANNTVATEKIRLTSAGDLGIGTSFPSLKMDIRSATTSTSGRLAVQNSDGSVFTTLYSGHSGDAPWFGWTSGTDLRFASSTNLSGSGFAEKLRIKDNGNVLIGSAISYSRLTVSNGNSARSGITISDANTASLMLFAGNNSDAVIGIDTQSLVFKTNSSAGQDNGNERMRLTSNGNFLIGSTTGTAKLNVAGNINQQHIASVIMTGVFVNILDLSATGMLDVPISAGRAKIYGFENGQNNVSYCEYYIVRTISGYAIQQIGTRVDFGNTNGQMQAQISGNFIQVKNVANSSLGAARIVLETMKA